MLRDSSQQANSSSDPAQPTTDASGEHFVAELRALYVAPEVPQHLRQTGAEQVRLQLASGNHRHAQPGMFRLLRHVRAVPGIVRPADTVHVGARVSERLGGRGHRPRLPVTAAVSAVALISLLAAALFAWQGPLRSGAVTGPASRTATPSLTIPHMMLTSVAMVSANDGWAFGSKWSTPSSGVTCLVLHYDGTTWAQHPGSACAPMDSISMLSADDGWAVGGNTILHYTQGNWHAVTIDAPFAQTMHLASIAMTSPDEGWAVGWSDTSNVALVLHYSRGQWIPADVTGMNSDVTSSLRGIAMVSPREGWAVGSQFVDRGEATLMLHYINGKWTKIDWSMPGSFNDVAAFSSGDAWVVGEDNSAAGPGLIVHLRNGVPIREDRPIPGLLNGIAMVSPSEGWAVGDGAATVHYHDGVWAREGLTIHEFYMVRISLVSATEGWAVGNSAGGSSRDPNASAILFHLSGGTWQIYPLSGV